MFRRDLLALIIITFQVHPPKVWFSFTSSKPWIYSTERFTHAQSSSTFTSDWHMVSGLISTILKIVCIVWSILIVRLDKPSFSWLLNKNYYALSMTVCQSYVLVSFTSNPHPYHITRCGRQWITRNVWNTVRTAMTRVVNMERHSTNMVHIGRVLNNVNFYKAHNFNDSIIQTF